MKFLQLKEALEDALPAPPPIPQPARPEVQAIAFYNPGEKRQTVVGGNIIRVPVDRTAALVVSKAPWWAMPPATPAPPPPKPVKPQTAQPIIKRKARQSMSTTPNIHKISNPAQAPGITSTPKPIDVVNVELTNEFHKRAENSLAEVKNLLDQATDARAALDVLCEYWKREWMDFMTQAGERLKELRMHRMAFEVETKVLLASMRDVRAFYLDKNYETEVARLNEFATLCERLQKLKQMGVLDAVADTMLKLAVPKEP